MIPIQLPAGAEEITISSVAKTALQYIQEAAGAPDWKPQRGSSLYVQVKTNAVRYSVSFTPTVENGMLITASNGAEWIRTGLDKVKFIRDDAADATVTFQVFQDNNN